MLKSILFVCTGNTCRSPMAEGLFKKMLSDRGITGISVGSAGTMAFGFFPASHYAIEVMNEEGIDISAHRSKKITSDLIGKYNMIFTMTSLQRDEVLSGCPSSANKVFVLKDGGIQDPIGESIDAYSNICKILKETLGGVIEKWL